MFIYIMCVCVCGFRGIRYISKHRAQRYAMIADLLVKEQHDVVLLQEVRYIHTGTNTLVT